MVVAQMANSNGKLSWGACINTTCNRVCDPQGQFNREGADFETVTYADLDLVTWCTWKIPGPGSTPS